MRKEFCHKYRRRLAFAQTDAAGVAHFSALLDLVEEAEHDFLQSLGIEVIGSESGWPRVGLQVNFTAPAKFHDQLEVWLRLKKVGESSITWRFEIYRVEDETQIAEGEMTVCHVRRALRRETKEFVFGRQEWVPAPLPEKLVNFFV